MAAGVVVREIVVEERQVEVVGLVTEEKTVWKVGLLVVRMKMGANVDPMARDYREVGVYPVQFYRVWVRKEVYSLKRLADAV